MSQMSERQCIKPEEIDDKLLDRMFDVKRQEKDMDRVISEEEA